MSRYITFGLIAVATTFSVGCAESNSQVRIRSAVEAQHQAMSACYEDALEVDPAVDGEMQVALTVDEQGRVDDVAVEHGDVADEEMPVCIATALSNIEMRRPPSDEARIAYTLRFRSRD